MSFHLIDMNTWERAEHYHYYRDIIKTRYSLTANIDITKLLVKVKEKNLKFYPIFIYILISIINKNKEFRMCLDEEDRLGYWDITHPSYTIFHKEDNTFSDIWTRYNVDFSIFYYHVVQDIKIYKERRGVKAKPDTPKNFCPISCIPWVSFTGYASDTYAESRMLYPILLFGKYFSVDRKILLPLSISVNHAVADGFHTCKLFNEIQEFVDNRDMWLVIK